MFLFLKLFLKFTMISTECCLFCPKCSKYFTYLGFFCSFFTNISIFDHPKMSYFALKNHLFLRFLIIRYVLWPCFFRSPEDPIRNFDEDENDDSVSDGASFLVKDPRKLAQLFNKAFQEVRF